ncbi:hypothetical protein PIB30_010138 [Stylosanthes scabra]|uniref:Ubiquitin-like protease family profile domain-containing protein n=1 Tax=Stylosanthes scabra TaxID=79078 RepID=A0ABU6Z7C0_9FABA|nr:hypothetical protein [Stylosanthes scabra]
MFEKYEQEWMDVEKRPHSITTLVNHKEYISYLDKKRLMLEDLKAIHIQQGENALEPMYINIPQQPNQYDCGVYVMKWMELLDPNVLKACYERTKEHNIQPWT